MRFIMSTRLAWSANYCNEEGQVVFRTESPAGPCAWGQDVKVLRVVPPCIDSNPEVASEADLRDFYEDVGEVNYRVFSSSRISGPNPAILEIFSAGKHMVELILMTFIYVEKLRGDREGVSKSHYNRP